jgi:5'-3' exonuclease
VRDYLELEFQDLALPFAFDVERIVDDFVLFCMLIGNDFLPGKFRVFFATLLHVWEEGPLRCRD